MDAKSNKNTYKNSSWIRGGGAVGGAQTSLFPFLSLSFTHSYCLFSPVLSIHSQISYA
jgi:hypothetical protein